MDTVVCNASPLITLAKADLLDLIPKEFSVAVVPSAVIEEILQGPENDPMKGLIHKLSWLKQLILDPPLTPLGSWQLGRGESEVIEYARRIQRVVVLLDDKDGRRVAQALQIPVLGTLGLVARSARRGGLAAFDIMTERLLGAGICLDDSVISSVRGSLMNDLQ